MQSANPDSPANQAFQFIDMHRQIQEFARQAALVLGGAYTSLDRPEGSWDRDTMSAKAKDFFITLDSIKWGDDESHREVLTKFVSHKCDLVWAFETSENIQRVTGTLRNGNQTTDNLISKYDSWKDRTGNSIRHDIDLKERTTSTEEVINSSKAQSTAQDEVYRTLGFIKAYSMSLNPEHELHNEYKTWQGNESNNDIRRMINEIDTAEDQDID